MNRIYPILLILFFGKTVYSQTITGGEKAEVYIGLDVFKNLPPLLLGKDYIIQNAVIFEPSIRVQKGNGCILFHLGLMKASTNNPHEELTFRHLKGAYVRVGTERKFERHNPLVIGWNGMLSYSDFRGTFKLFGTTFGNYEGGFHESNMAIGTEVYWAYNSQIKTRWVVRSLLRITAALQTGDLNADYYPGIGFTDNNSQVLVSVGTTVQIYRRVR